MPESLGYCWIVRSTHESQMPRFPSRVACSVFAIKPIIGRLYHGDIDPDENLSSASTFARRLTLTRAIYLDPYMLSGVYSERGICLRNHCRPEPPRDIDASRLVTTVGWADRASTSYASTNRVKAPASAARGRHRGIHGGRTAPSLPAETRAASG